MQGLPVFGYLNFSGPPRNGPHDPSRGKGKNPIKSHIRNWAEFGLGPFGRSLLLSSSSEPALVSQRTDDSRERVHKQTFLSMMMLFASVYKG